MRILAAALLVSLITAIPASAQIYSWRDDEGRLVLSNTRPSDREIEATYKAAAPIAPRPAIAPESGTKPERAQRYSEVIEEQAAAHNVSADLVRAVIQAESAFNPNAVSPKGAMGLMQLMPATARELGVNNPFQPEENIRGGVAYLAWLLDRYDQRVDLALAAYNAGPGAVERYGTIPPYRETRDYVKKITTATEGVTATARPVAKTVIYRWVEVVDGQPTPRYATSPPAGVSYEIVSR